MKTCLIDTSALLAMLDRSDKYHASAATFIAQNRQVHWYLSEYIFAESITLVKSRLGAQAAINLGEQLHKSLRFHVVPFNQADVEELWQFFSRYHDKAWSYIDCSLNIVGHKHQVSTVFSFDHHFNQMVDLSRLP